MEERTNAKEEPQTADESGIVELTPEMALADQSQVQVVELTNTADSPKTASSQVPTVEQVEKEPAPPSEPPDIEQQVDAAFEKAQIETAERTKAEAQQDQLLEQLSDLPDQVDDAARKAADTDIETVAQAPPAADSVEPAQKDGSEFSDQAQPQPVDEPQFDEARLARDAALIDEALAPEAAPAGEQAETDDDIIDLTDIVDPVEFDPEADLAPVTLETDQEDEELLELTDIVDTPERQAVEPVAPADVESAADLDDVLGLADIAATAEVQAETQSEPEPAAPSREALQTDDEEIIELTDIVDPAELEALDQTVLTAQQADLDDEEIIELTDIVDPALLKGESRNEPPSGQMDLADDDIIELTDIVNPAELEGSEIPIEPMSPGSDDDVLRLSDVLDPPQKKSPSAADDE